MARHCTLPLALAIYVNFLIGSIRCNDQVNSTNLVTPSLTTVNLNSSGINQFTSSKNVTSKPNDVTIANGGTADSPIFSPSAPPPLPPPPIFLEDLNTTSTVTPNGTTVDIDESTTVESILAVSSSSNHFSTIAPSLHVTALPTTPTITEDVTQQYGSITPTLSPFTSIGVMETKSMIRSDSTVLSLSLVSETNISDKDIAQGIADSLHHSSKTLIKRKKRDVSATSGRYNVTVLDTDRQLNVTFVNFTVSEDNVAVSAVDVMPLLSNTTVIIEAFKNISITVSSASTPIIVQTAQVIAVETTTTASHTSFVPYTGTGSTDVSHTKSETNTTSSTYDENSTVDAAGSPTMSESSDAISETMVTRSSTKGDEITMTDAGSGTTDSLSTTDSYMPGSGELTTYGDTDIFTTTHIEYDTSATEFMVSGSGEFVTVTTLVDSASTVTESEEPMTSGTGISTTEFITDSESVPTDSSTSESSTMAFTQTETMASSTTTVNSSTVLTLRFTSSKNVSEQQIADIILEAILNTTQSNSTRKRRAAVASEDDITVNVFSVTFDAPSSQTANFNVERDGRTLQSSEAENLISVTDVEQQFRSRSIPVSDVSIISTTDVPIATTAPITYTTCNVTVMNLTSILIEFNNAGDQQITVTITHRHKFESTIGPLNTVENPVQVSNLVPDTLYDITAEYGEFRSSCTAHTYPCPINVIVGEKPMPNGAFVFVGSNPRVTQWEMQLRSDSDDDRNWNTSSGQYFGFYLGNLTVNTEYRIRARPSEIFDQTVEGTEFGEWTYFTTRKWSVFGRVTMVNVPYGNGNNSYFQSMISDASMKLGMFSDLLILKTENDTGTGLTTVHYEIVVDDTKLPIDTNFTLNGSDFQDSAINNGGEVGGTFFWTASGVPVVQYDVGYITTIAVEECTTPEALLGIVTYTSENGTQSSVSINKLLVTEGNNGVCLATFSLTDQGIEGTGSKAISNNMERNTVYGVGVELLKEVLLDQSSEKLLYTRTFQAQISVATNETRTHILFDRNIDESDLRLSELELTASGDSAIVRLPNVPKSVKYEISINSTSATLNETDIDGSEFLQVQLNDITLDSTSLQPFNVIVSITVLDHEGNHVIGNGEILTNLSLTTTTAALTTETSRITGRTACISSVTTVDPTVTTTADNPGITGSTADTTATDGSTLTDTMTTETPEITGSTADTTATVGSALTDTMTTETPRITGSAADTTATVGSTPTDTMTTENPGITASTADTTATVGSALTDTMTTENPGITASTADTTATVGSALTDTMTTETPGIIGSTADTTATVRSTPTDTMTTETPGIIGSAADTTATVGSTPTDTMTTENPGITASTADTTAMVGSALTDTMTTETPGITGSAADTSATVGSTPTDTMTTENPGITGSTADTTATVRSTPTVTRTTETPGTTGGTAETTATVGANPTVTMTTETPGITGSTADTTATVEPDPTSTFSTETTSPPRGFPWYYILIIVLGVLCLILLVIIVWIWCRKKNDAVYRVKQMETTATSAMGSQDFQPGEEEHDSPDILSPSPPLGKARPPLKTHAMLDTSIAIEPARPILDAMPPPFVMVQEDFTPKFTHTVHPIRLPPIHSVIKSDVGDSLTDDAMMRQRRDIERLKNKARLRKKKPKRYDPYDDSGEIDQILAPDMTPRRSRPPHSRQPVDFGRHRDPDMSVLLRNDHPGRYTRDSPYFSSSDSVSGVDSPATARQTMRSLLNDAFPLLAPNARSNLVAPMPMPIQPTQDITRPRGAMIHSDGRTTDFGTPPNVSPLSGNQPQMLNIFQAPRVRGLNEYGTSIGYPPSYFNPPTGPMRTYPTNPIIPTVPFLPGAIPPPNKFGQSNVPQVPYVTPASYVKAVKDELARMDSTPKKED